MDHLFVRVGVCLCVCMHVWSSVKYESVKKNNWMQAIEAIDIILTDTFYHRNRLGRSKYDCY